MLYSGAEAFQPSQVPQFSYPGPDPGVQRDKYANDMKKVTFPTLKSGENRIPVSRTPQSGDGIATVKTCGVSGERLAAFSGAYRNPVALLRYAADRRSQSEYERKDQDQQDRKVGYGKHGNILTHIPDMPPDL